MHYESYECYKYMSAAAGGAERGSTTARSSCEHGGGAQRQDPRRLHEATAGLTLIEILISLAVLTVLTIGIGTFATKFLTLPKTALSLLDQERDARHAVETMGDELRSMAQGATGSYVLESATANSVIFFANIDTDTTIERVRYFLDDTMVKRGITKPTGTPPAYMTTNEKLSVLASDVRMNTVPLFTYFDTSYAGSGAPLAAPITPAAVRYVRMTVIVDQDPSALPAPFTIQSGVAPRVLKDNL